MIRKGIRALEVVRRMLTGGRECVGDRALERRAGREVMGGRSDG